MEDRRGDVGQARDWYRQAIDSGHAEMAERANRDMRDLERREAERGQAEWFGRYGFQAYADPGLMRRGGADDACGQPGEGEGSGHGQGEQDGEAPPR